MSIKSFLGGLFTKAGNIQVTNADGQPVGTGFQIINGTAYAQDLAPANLIKYNTGWVSTANGRVSSTCASVPLKLYYYNRTGKKLEVTRHKKLDDRTRKEIAKSQNIELKMNEDIEEITDHPILDLFNSINPTMNYYDWCELNFEYLGLLGNSYNEVISENGIPVAFNPLLAEYITPVATGKKQGKILYYLYKPEDKEYKFMPEQILHFATYAPGNTLIGKGDLETCLSAQERYCYYDAYEKYLGVNNSRPDFIVGYKQKMNDKDLKEAYRQWNKRFGGVRNSGKVGVTTGEYQVTNLGFPPKDMQYATGRTWSLKEIAGAFGVPEALLSVSDVNRANAVEAMNHFLKMTIYPKMVKYCSRLNEIITPKYDTDLFIWFSETYLENPVDKSKNSILAYEKGIISRNEARDALGFEKDNEYVEDVSEGGNNEERTEENTENNQ